MGIPHRVAPNDAETCADPENAQDVLAEEVNDQEINVLSHTDPDTPIDPQQQQQSTLKTEPKASPIWPRLDTVLSQLVPAPRYRLIR